MLIGVCNPTLSPIWGFRYTAFLDRLADNIAPLVAGRAGVWVSLWNEPFDWDAATDGTLWLAEMTALVSAARAAGIDNVLVIPCGRMGQDEAVLLSHGARVLAVDSQIVFDVHAYNRWLGDSEEAIVARITALHDAGLAIMFGEVGPDTPGGLMATAPFLRATARYGNFNVIFGPFHAHFPAACHPSRAVYCALVGGHVCGMLIGACDPMLWPIYVFRTGVSVCAWLYSCNSDSGNALLETGCATPTAWGDLYFAHAAARAVAPPRIQPRGRKAFMHYLPWYSSTDNFRTRARQGWCGGAGVDCANTAHRQYASAHPPLIGEYSQYDPHVAEYHLLLSHAAHTDGFIVNLNPSSPEQIELLTVLVDATLAATQRWPSWFSQRLIISYDDRAAVTDVQVRANYQLIRDKWLGNATAAPAFFVDDDVTLRFPMLLWSEAAPGLHFALAAEIFGAVPAFAGGGSGVLLLARNAVGFNTSHGNFGWVSPLSVAGSTETERAAHWGEPYLNDFDWITARQAEFGGVSGIHANAVAMLPVYPGFDDANVPVSWNAGDRRWLGRTVDAGNTLELTFERAVSRAAQAPTTIPGQVAVDTPWLQVITFNDWPEGTNVEPHSGPDPFAGLTTVQQRADHFKRALAASATPSPPGIGQRRFSAVHRLYTIRTTSPGDDLSDVSTCLAGTDADCRLGSQLPAEVSFIDNILADPSFEGDGASATGLPVLAPAVGYVIN